MEVYYLEISNSLIGAQRFLVEEIREVGDSLRFKVTNENGDDINLVMDFAQGKLAYDGDDHFWLVVEYALASAIEARYT